jgi:hypothetical protein
MSTAYTTLLRLAKPATGELSGTWGDTVNQGITDLVDAAIAGRTSIAMADADYTLSTANGAADESRYMMLNMTGALTAPRNVVCPTSAKLYIIKNATTGGFAITLKTTAGTGISVANGATMFLACDGTNVVDAFSKINADVTGNLTGNVTGDASGNAATATLAGAVSVTATASGAKDIALYYDPTGDVLVTGRVAAAVDASLIDGGNGTYTPTLTASSNCSGLSVNGAIYMRVGIAVMANISFSVTRTATGVMAIEISSPLVGAMASALGVVTSFTLQTPAEYGTMGMCAGLNGNNAIISFGGSGTLTGTSMVWQANLIWLSA